ncbi:MAG: SpoIID/LytB domain-containing protein [Candidatus Zixiibacteriota bacterium]|nr:MAG: SpoIID/LytB domain-containing protein [candidate division Zixibacteria bacterium]
MAIRKRIEKAFTRLGIVRLEVIKLCIIAAVILQSSCSERPVFREEIFYPQIKQPAVRVKLLETKNSQAVSSNGSFLIRCLSRDGQRSTYHATHQMLVEPRQGALTLREKNQWKLETDLKRVSFFPKENNSRIFLNGRPYRGILEMAPGENSGSLLVLNLIHVEEYLKGVVPAEIGKLSRQELEALKAQAVAARTYSLSRLGQHAERGYDLEATVADQVYQGARGEDPLASRAVDLTRGEVLVSEGKLISAYYHANSGGMTEYVEKVWDLPKKSYLVPVDDESFCSWSETFAWQESWTKETLERNLIAFLQASISLPQGELGNLLNLQMAGRSPSGRLELLRVITDRGIFPIRGDGIRRALGKGNGSESILPSTCFDLVIERDENGDIRQVRAQGRGNGHGVGMCQIGAIGMARKGYAYQDILTHYYSDAQMIRCY